jgi:ABC-2 type transport system ATP-binding protein
LRVLGRDPWIDRDSLMCDVAFITDVAVLPHWIKVAQLLAYVAGVHPRFDRAKAIPFLERTSIRPESKVKDLSRGMMTQLHLAIVMAIDARLLVMDEPTLGLDILYRKKFYDALLEDHYEKNRTIVLATHDIEEIEHIMTDVIFLDRGRIALSASMDEVESRYREVKVRPASLPDARRLSPVYEREALGQRIMIFDGVSLETLAGLGDVRTPSVADLFVAQLSAGDRR